MESKRLEHVIKYLQLRENRGTAIELLKYLTCDAVIIDQDKNKHIGIDALTIYYSKWHPGKFEYKTPSINSDLDIKVDFSVTILFLTYKFEAIFKFPPESDLIKEIIISSK